MKRLDEIKALLATPGDLSDEQLEELRVELKALYKTTRESENLDGEGITALEDMVALLKAIDTEDAARTEAATELESKLEALDSEVLADEDADTDEATEEASEDATEEAADEPAEEATDADAEADDKELVSLSHAARRVAKANKSQPAPQKQFAQAKKGQTWIDLAKQAIDTWDSSVGHASRRLNVAKLATTYDDSRFLNADLSENMRKLQAVIAPDALVASGGVCGPVTPRYDLAVESVTDRPVANGIARFGADRGGANIVASPKLSQVGTSGGGSGQAVDVITSAEDAGGSTKPYQAITCPTATEVLVSAVTEQFEFGEMTARYNPEIVAAWLQLGAAAHARAAENEILTAMGTAANGVTVITENLSLGASRDVLRYLSREAAQMRSRHRMAHDATVRVILPAWFIALYANDVANSAYPVTDEVDQAYLEHRLALFNIAVTWTLDGVGSGPQIAAAQIAGTLNGWGAVIRWYMFPEGSWIWLDGGELSIDIVRDSTMVAANKFRTFFETFENTAFVGVESHVVTATICESGLSGGFDNEVDFCTTGS